MYGSRRKPRRYYDPDLSLRASNGGVMLGPRGYTGPLDQVRATVSAAAKTLRVNSASPRLPIINTGTLEGEVVKHIHDPNIEGFLDFIRLDVGDYAVIRWAESRYGKKLISILIETRDELIMRLIDVSLAPDAVQAEIPYLLELIAQISAADHD